MRCPNCGHEASGPFCTNCGARVANEAAAVTTGQPEPTAELTGVDRALDSMWRGGEALDAPPTLNGKPAPFRDPAEASGYPVRVVIQPPPPGRRFSSIPLIGPTSPRLWAFPVFGLWAKLSILLPHIFILLGLALAVLACQLFLWIPVLFTGEYPRWAITFVGGYLRWSTRTLAFLAGLADQYPRFTWYDDGDRPQPYSVRVTFDAQPTYNRVFAVPVLGAFLRALALIPHIAVLFVLGTGSLLSLLILWVPELFNARTPNWGYALVGGTLRLGTRVAAYGFGLTDIYPPFGMRN